MAETYQFVWGEVHQIEPAIVLAKRVCNDANYVHLETQEFDLDADNIGIRITIPHDSLLANERKEL